MTTIGPRSVDRSTPNRRRNRAGSPPGRPPSTVEPPVPWTQGSTPAFSLACWRAGVSTSTFASAEGRSSAVQPVQREHRRAARARGAALTPGPRCARASAALTGSVGPAPYAGHHRATVHAPHAGLVAWQTRRPCQMRWWLSMVQSRLGNSAPISCSALTGSVWVGPAEAAGQPAEVGVDGDAGDAEGVAEDDVGGLAADAGQVDEVLEAGRYLAAVPLDQRGAELEQGLGLGAEEAERADDLLEVVAVGPGHRGGVGVGREQGRADGVDPLVGGLGAQHGDDEELERVVEVELAPRVGVGLGEHAVDAAGPADQGGTGLAGGRGLRSVAAVGRRVAGPCWSPSRHAVSLRRRTDATSAPPSACGSL